VALEYSGLLVFVFLVVGYEFFYPFVLDYNLDRFTELKAVVVYGFFFLPYLNVVPLGSAVARLQWLCLHYFWTATTSARGLVVAYFGDPLPLRRLRVLRLPPVLQRGASWL